MTRGGGKINSFCRLNFTSHKHSSFKCPVLTSDPIRVLSCAWRVFRTNRIAKAAISIYLSVYSNLVMQLEIHDVNKRQKLYGILYFVMRPISINKLIFKLFAQYQHQILIRLLKCRLPISQFYGSRCIIFKFKIVIHAFYHLLKIILNQ